jgi:hypothetical protein
MKTTQTKRVVTHLPKALADMLEPRAKEELLPTAAYIRTILRKSVEESPKAA